MENFQHKGGDSNPQSLHVIHNETSLALKAIRAQILLTP